MTTLLETGASYAATVTLGLVDRLGSNDQVKQRFESVGFIQVQIFGSGKHRTVKGKWAGPTAEHEVPSQVNNIERL